MEDKLSNVVGVIFLVIILITIVWVGKELSYHFWYESQVQETVQLMIKDKCLR